MNKLRRLSLGLGCASLLALAGCVEALGEPVEPMPLPTPTVSSQEETSWISPPKVTVTNFYAGAEADWDITIYNGHVYETVRKRVTTESGETVASIPLTARVHGAKLDSVVLLSDDVADNLKADSYSGDMLVVSGFAPSTTRMMSIQYECDSRYTVAFDYPTWADEQYRQRIRDVANWVTVSEPDPLLQPRETKKVSVVLKMPSDVNVNAYRTVSLTDAAMKSIKDGASLVVSDNTNAVAKALFDSNKESQFVWHTRTIAELANELGISEQDALSIVRGQPAIFYVSDLFVFWITVTREQFGNLQGSMACAWVINLRQ